MNHQPLDAEQNFDPTSSSFLTSETRPACLVEESLSSTAKREELLHELSLVLHQPDETANAQPGFRQSTGSNLRQFSRCPIEEDRTSAILSIHGRRFDCRLVEMSIGGFGVVVTGQPKFVNGAVGYLRAPSLNYVVSVTRIESRPGGTYIGLKQVEEIVEPRRLAGDASPIIGYLVAAFAGMLIATAAYVFMSAK